jgi:fatty-acyl-CoA synthase
MKTLVSHGPDSPEQAASVQKAWALGAWVRALDRTASFGRGEGRTLPALVAEMAATHSQRTALIGDGESLTYAQLVGRTAQYARWALREGVAQGDAVGLMLPNCTDYVAAWLGIVSVGGVVALVNPHLTGEAVRHALGAVGAKHVIVAADLEPAVLAVAGGANIWSHGAGGVSPRIDALVGDFAPKPPEVQAPSLSDLALYIYTSGTTGLPKAARVSHRRVAEWACWFAGMIDTQPDDRMYNCLPMYHSVGGVVAVGAMLVGGGSVLIRPKFSASRFWDDVAEHGCTLFQYIGELCRYLANSPPHPREREHNLRLCCGNGLRGDVWAAFQERFAIPRILEFYAATEGNVSLYNCEGRPGAIGRVPPFLAHRFPVALVKCDPETGALVRDEAGLCVRSGRDEVGEALGRIGDAAAAEGRPFEGYTDAAASEKKIARDVLVQGDAWFRTGDLMRRDGGGFFYFVDRIGDTFRWKGENVSTEEVASVLAGCPGVTEAVVYGVAVPGAEGRAGMAALTVDDRFDLALFRAHIQVLPHYARPVFVRVGGSIAATTTFKQAKVVLAREGFDPALGDALYFDDRAAGAFVRIDAGLYEGIWGGVVRV